MKRINLISTLLMAAVGMTAVPEVAPAQGKVTKTSTGESKLRQLKTLYIQKIEGDAVFRRQLTAELRALDFRFVSNKQSADALIAARGNYDRGGFSGEITLRTLSGALLWRETARRPAGNSRMVYARLTAKLRRALGK